MNIRHLHGFDVTYREAVDYADLVSDGRVLGAVLRTIERVKPVFVSPGHKISLKSAVEIVLSCCAGYKLPEPVRLAHLAVNRFRREQS